MDQEKIINDFIDNLFNVVTNKGTMQYQFKDTTICEDWFELFRDDNWVLFGLHTFGLSFRSDPPNKPHHFYNFDLSIDKSTGKIFGEVFTPHDYNIPDSGCITLYNIGVNIGYIDPDGDFCDFIYYNKKAIMRRHSIQSIIGQII